MVVVQSRFRVANGLEASVREAFIARPRTRAEDVRAAVEAMRETP